MIDENKGKGTTLIPTLDPDKRLLSYINNLKDYSFTEIIILNDVPG